MNPSTTSPRRVAACLTATALAASLAAISPAVAQSPSSDAAQSPSPATQTAPQTAATDTVEQSADQTAHDGAATAVTEQPGSEPQADESHSPAWEEITLYGSVTDGTGSPISSAKITVCPSPGTWRPTGQENDTTADDDRSEDCRTAETMEFMGDFQISVVPAESIDVTITHGNYHTHQETMRWEDARKSFHFELEPVNGYAAQGRIISDDFDEWSHDLSGTEVWVCTVDECQTAATGHAGYFFLDGYEIEEFWAKAYRNDFVPQMREGKTGSTTIQPGFEDIPRGVQIRVDPLEKAGSGVWFDGVDINGTVPVVTRTVAPQIKATGCAGGSFSYFIEDGKEGHNSIGYFTETSPGTFEGTIPMPAEADSQTVVLRDQCHHDEFVNEHRFGIRYVTPSGIVVDGDGNAIPGATVTLERMIADAFTALPEGSQWMSPENREPVVTTGADGAFRWETGPGMYRAKVTAPGYVSAATGESVAYSPEWVEMDQPGAMQIQLKKAPETKLSPTIGVTLPQTGARVGEPTDVTVTVSGDDLTPTGTVSLTLNGESLPGCEGVPVSVDGTAMCPVSFPEAGDAELVAEYSGNATYESFRLATGLPVAKGHQVVTVGELQGVPVGSTDTVRITSNAPGTGVSVSSRNPHACTVTHREGDVYEVTGVSYGVCSLHITAPGNDNWEAATPFVAGMGVTHCDRSNTPVSGFAEVTRTDGTDTVTSVPLTVTHAGEATIVAAVTTIGGEVTAVTGGDLEWTRMTGYTHDGVTTSYWTADTDQPVTDLVVTAQLDDESTTSTIAITVT